MAQNSNNDMDFGALFEAHMNQIKTDFNVGDRLTGTVTAVDRNSVFVDIGGRSDGILDRSEVLDDEGNLTVKPGDTVEAYCVGTDDDTVRLTTRMAGSVADASLFDAYEGGIPVEGRVMAERKGGYDVQVASRSAFCPYSQMDLHRKEPDQFIGQTFTFIIAEYRDDGRNIILSRRRFLEHEQTRMREELQENLGEGDIIQGTVTRVMDFGAFVDIGAGVEGLIHVSELGWGRNIKPEDVVQPGQSVSVTVLTIDWENDRLSLSLRNAEGDPWEDEAIRAELQEGRRVRGTITKLMPFGAFVELKPGIEGLVHISRLGAGWRVNHPSEVVNEGDEVEVSILDVDDERRRIALSMDETRGDLEDEEQGPAPQGVQVGATVTGIVDGHRDFGVFVKLPDDRTGLLHISQVELKGSANSGRALFKMFPPQSEITVVIQQIEGNRISLTLPETLAKEAEQDAISDYSDKTSEGFGSIGGLFDNLDV